MWEALFAALGVLLLGLGKWVYDERQRKQRDEDLAKVGPLKAAKRAEGWKARVRLPGYRSRRVCDEDKPRLSTFDPDPPKDGGGVGD